MNEYTPDRERTGTAVNEFVAIDSVVAVAAPHKHTDTIWFIMVTSNKMTMNKPIANFHRRVFGVNNKSKSLCFVK